MPRRNGRYAWRRWTTRSRKTLGELERKLAELERTLNAIERRAAERTPAAPSQSPPSRQPQHRWSRIVERRSSCPHPRRRHRHRARRPHPAHAPASSAPPARAPWPPRAPQPPREPPRAPQPPSAAELLRFRDRLERAARELTHDYDELLGRLSYAAVPTTTGPTISFARGAPSLDIVDVDGLRDAAVRAFESDPAGTTAYGTVGRLPAPAQLDRGPPRRGARARAGDQRLDAGGRVPVRAARARGRRGDRGAPHVRPHAAVAARARGARARGGAAARRHRHGRAGGAADGQRRRCSRRSRTSSPTSRTPPATRCRCEKRRRLLELAADHGFMVFEDDPYVELRFSGETLPTMLSMDPERVVYASSFSKTVCPGIRVGYLVGPPDLIAAIAQLATNTYISPNMVAQSIVYEFCASGAIERSIETVKAALAERAQTLGERAAQRAGGGRVRGAAGRLLHVGDAARGHRRGRPLPGGRRARRGVREGHRLPAGGRREHAAPGLLGRDARADRHGRRAPRRGLPLAY